MSQNYPYRKPPPDTDLRTDPGPYRSVDYRHSSADRDFYRQPQDSFSVSSSCPSSSRGSGVLQSSQDNVLSILSSCGLEPSDLALLAELPEDVLTIESLPHILRQIKCKKGTVKPFPPRAPSPSSSSSYPPSCSSSRDWDQLHRTSVQYPLDHLPPPPPPSEQLMDRWNNPITVSSGRAELPPSSSLSSSSLGYTVDFHRRQGPSDYGKAGPVPSYSPARRGDRAPSSRFSEAGPADYRSSALVTASPLPSEHQSKPLASRRDTSSTRSSQSSPSMPTRKEALDFHGKVPPSFPYSCSLCDITVLSQKVWIQHVTGRHHADGQLSLLQQFPNWDCRMQTVRRDDKSEKKKDGGKGAPAASQTSQSNSKWKQKKNLEKGKVVCIKFPSQSVDEKYLRKLAEPFGKIIKVIMFPSLGFVEMGSVDQAKDLVKFHSNYPPTVNGEQLVFSVSSAFNFLQSSRVVSFTPAPSGEDGKSDLINIIKRFGPPLYTLFLPSMVFVEMKNAPDAQKLVDYYLSNTLRINSDLICVSFSGEYKTLMRVSKAKRYEEENESTKKSTTKRTRSSSRDRTTENKKRRSRSRDKASKEERTRTRSRSRDKSKEKSSRDAKTRSRSQDKLDRKRKSRTRSRSRDKSTSEKRTRTRSKSGSREKTKEKSNKESKKGSQAKKPDESREKSNRDQKTRSASRDKSSRETKAKSTTQEKSSKERKSRSKSRSVEKSSRDKKSRSRERSSNKSSRRDGEKTAEPEKPDAESTSKGQPSPLEDSKPEVSNTEEVEGEAALPGEESDIEGMEVIAEDGENLADDDEEALQEEEKKESPKERAPEKDEVKEVIGGEPGNEEKPASEKEIKKEEKEEVEESKEATETPLQEDLEDFPVDLENCITLDELEEDDSDDQGGESADEPKSTSKSSRVFYFGHLPPNYALFDFFQLLRNFGKVVRYYLIGNRREGFIEMSSSSAALKAVEELVSKPAIHNCPKLKARISTKYYRLDNGWVVHSDGSNDKDSRGRKREKRSKSKTSDQDETDRRSKGRKESPKKTSEKSGKKTPEKDSGSKKPPEKDSSGKKTPKKESTSKTSPEKDAKNILETKSTGKKTPAKDLPSKKTSGKDSTTKKTPAKKSASRKTLETKSTFRETSAEESKKSPKRESLDKEPPEKVLKNGPEKESAGRKTPEKGSSCAEIPDSETLEPKGAPDNNSVPQTTVKKELKKENTQQNEEPAADKAPSEKDYIKKETPRTFKQEEEETPIDVCMEAGPNVKDAESPDPPVSSTEPSKPPPEQDAKPQFEPAEGAAEPQKPTKPVGTEFVRPVVGYFCNLCQQIFAEEDEAKQQHCSSLSHYSKYQEKTGRDPWTS
ncbi:matrin-3-like isoform X2 [Astatotilapia calliptera]|uniref:matrin-3-like isoform X2 n=1 Tax=Astatotilapia calliptera TaxID=8154 RepID=UPI000E3FA2C4|nr:matrin-3-like isoform X2 [Astatotilapia calliptera]